MRPPRLRAARAILRALAFLALFAGAMAGVYLLNEPHFEDEFWAIVIALVSAGAVTLGAVVWPHSIRARSDLRQVQALIGGRRPRHGQLAAVSGVLRPTGEPCVAPLSGRQCVACSYTVHQRYHRRSSSGPTSRRRLCYEGYHLAPCAVVGPEGPVRLLAFPDLSETEDVPLDPALAPELARRSPVVTGPLGRAARISDVFSDASGAVSVDIKLGEVAHWGGVDLAEQALTAARQVTVIGRWDEERKAVTPAPQRPDGVPVYLADAAGAETVVATNVRLLCWVTAGSIAFGLVVGGLKALLDALLD